MFPPFFFSGWGGGGRGGVVECVSLFGGSHKKDYKISVSILGSPYYWKLPFDGPSLNGRFRSLCY